MRSGSAAKFTFLRLDPTAVLNLVPLLVVGTKFSIDYCSMSSIRTRFTLDLHVDLLRREKSTSRGVL